MKKRPIIETETMVLDLQHPINGYNKIHRTLHYVDGNCERVVVAFTEEELKLANEAPKMLEALKELLSEAQDLMNFCTVRKHIDSEEETLGQIGFRLATEKASLIINKINKTDTPIDSYKGNNPMVVLNHLLGYLNDHQRADAKSFNLQGNNTHLLGYLSEEQWADAKKIIPKDCHKHLLQFATDVDNAYQTSFKDIINQDN